MAGKTGTHKEELMFPRIQKYEVLSTFAGYFLGRSQMILVIAGNSMEPDKTVVTTVQNVSGPFLKSVATQKIYASSPLVDEGRCPMDAETKGLDEDFQKYFAAPIKLPMKVPNVGVWAGWMQFLFLKILGIEVRGKGNGKVQS